MGHFPFVKTDWPENSSHNDNFTFNQNYPQRSQMAYTKEMVFQQKLLEKSVFIVKMTGPTMVRPVSSDFWKGPKRRPHWKLLCTVNSTRFYIDLIDSYLFYIFLKIPTAMTNPSMSNAPPERWPHHNVWFSKILPGGRQPCGVVVFPGVTLATSQTSSEHPHNIFIDS